VTGLAGRTVRNVVHVDVGGTGVRITLSNLYGQSPLALSHASIALAAAPSSSMAAEGTLRPLTFGGSRSVVIPAGGHRLSDAVRFQVPADSDLLVSTYSPTSSGQVTYHAHAQQVSYAAVGDHTEDTAGTAFTQQIQSWRYLTALDVFSDRSSGTVVAFGDSITDGFHSTPDTDHRWPDLLADRLRTEDGAPRYSVANAGISGNHLLEDGPGRPAANVSGLGRFQRDVLDRSNVRAVIVALGINDILHDPRNASAARIVAGLREVTREAHAHGLRVVGATLTPFGSHLGYNVRLEEIRESVNREIRAGGVFDAVVDFDRAVRDPYDPHKLRPQFDSGDHLHPDDQGYAAMAAAFDLSDLKGTAATSL
jgi:lysophospholipase L1-like esterase